MSSFLFGQSSLLLRRVIASLVLLCVGVMTFEQFSTDVCGDAVAHEAEVTAQTVSTDTPVLDAATNKKPESGQSVSHPGMHVCHCLHGHFGTLPVRHTIVGHYTSTGHVFEEPSARPPSIALEPPHRPPLFA